MTKLATSSNVSRGVVVWLTGLSGAGKSTISAALAPLLRAAGKRVEVLDGDAVRTHLSSGLGFSREDRDLNVGRIAFVAHLLSRNGVYVIVAAVSPYRGARESARALITGGAGETRGPGARESARALITEGAGEARGPGARESARALITGGAGETRGPGAREDRAASETRDAREDRAGGAGFLEVHVAPPLEECVARDTKGLYRRALAGELPQFTGVSDPYEPPLAPEVTLDTSRIGVDEAAQRIVRALQERGWLDANPSPEPRASTWPQ